ncbi:hypothetical protein ACWDV4_29765 [Micromonospora sp. NPDC003197]
MAGLARALSMAALVVLFERTNPIARSMHMFHADPGAMLTRLFLVFATYFGGFFVIDLAQSATELIFGVDQFGAAALSSIVWNLLSLPIYLVLLVALLVT